MDQLFPTLWNLPAPQVPNSLAVRRKDCPWHRRSWHSPVSSQTRFTRPALEWSAPVAQAVSERDYADPDCRSDSIVVLGDRINASIILVIVVIGSMLGFWKERGAADAVATLLAVMQTNATVLHDGNDVNVAFADVVPGDLCCGGRDDAWQCLLVEAHDLFMDESARMMKPIPWKKAAVCRPQTTRSADVQTCSSWASRSIMWFTLTFCGGDKPDRCGILCIYSCSVSLA